MTGSLIIVGFFFLGCLLGWSGLMPAFLQNEDLTMYVLYFLMFQVGLSIGSDKQLKEILTNIRPKLLLVPLATITGTLLFSALISFFLSRWSVTDCLAVGSGFAYYSLSTILITQLKEPTLGAQMAAELGTIALMSNIFREWIPRYPLSRPLAGRTWFSFRSSTGSSWISQFRFWLAFSALFNRLKRFCFWE